jgi:hypothetical protein
VYIGFIDIGLLRLKEKCQQQKQKRKEGKSMREKEGKHNRKRKKRESTTEKEEEGKHMREREPFMSSWSAITSLSKLLAATS